MAAEGGEPVGEGQEHRAPGPGHPDQLVEERLGTGHVLDDVRAVDDVERGVGERQVQAVPDQPEAQGPPGGGHLVPEGLDKDAGRPAPPEGLGEVPRAPADVEDQRAGQRVVVLDGGHGVVAEHGVEGVGVVELVAESPQQGQGASDAAGRRAGRGGPRDGRHRRPAGRATGHGAERPARPSAPPPTPPGRGASHRFVDHRRPGVDGTLPGVLGGAPPGGGAHGPASVGVVGQVDPGLGHGRGQPFVGGVDQHAGLPVVDGVAYPVGIGGQGRRAGRRRLHDGHAPAFMAGPVDQEPGPAHQVVLGGLVDPPHHLGPGDPGGQPPHGLELRPVTGHHQAAADLGVGQPPGLDEQVDPLVGNQPAQGEEERFGCLGHRWAGRRGHPGLDHPDPAGVHPDGPEVGRGGLGDGHEEAAAVDGRHDAVFDGPSHGGRRRREAGAPLVEVDMVDQADRRAAAPEGGEVREPVLHVDHQVGVGEPGGAVEGRPQVLAVGPSRVDHRVRVLADRAPADERHLVATGRQAPQEVVEHHLGAASLGVREVAPVEGDQLHPLRPRRRPGARAVTARVRCRAGGRGRGRCCRRPRCPGCPGAPGAPAGRRPARA